MSFPYLLVIASSYASFLLAAVTGDEGGCADEEEHDERERRTIVPHRVVDVLLDGGTEEFDVVHRQELRDGEGRDGWHEHHQYAARHARHGEWQHYLEELLPWGGAQVFGCLDVAAVHLLEGIVDRVNHERDEVVYHTKQQGSLAERKVGEVEERHGGEGAHQDVDPHRQDEEHHDGVGIFHLGLGQDIGRRIAQQDAEQGVEKGDADGVHKGVDGLRVSQKLLEVVEGNGAILIGECEHHDEYQRQYHEYRSKDGVWYRPTLARRYKLNELFQFLVLLFMKSLDFSKWAF